MEHSTGSFRVGDYISDGKKLGKGSFATVYLGHHVVRANHLVAIKVVDVERLSKSNQRLKRHLDSEIKIMKAVEHPHIVRQLEVVMDDKEEYMYVVLEFCDGGDFSKYLKKHKRITEDQARYFLRQLADGLKHLHERNIIHRDLKPHNLLLQRRSGTTGLNYHDWVLKIADFGFARFIEPESVASTLCGSPLYMAPEILFCQPYDAKADLWSVGAILFEMLVGSPPYNVRTQVELVRILLTSKIHFPKSLTTSDECFSLLQSLLKKNQGERISWEDFFAHPFVTRKCIAQQSPLALSSSDPTPVSSPLPIPLHKKHAPATDLTQPPTPNFSPSMSISPSSSSSRSTLIRVPSGMNLATTPPINNLPITHSSSVPATSSSEDSVFWSAFGHLPREETKESVPSSAPQPTLHSLEKGWGWLPPSRSKFQEESIENLSDSINIEILPGESSSSSNESFELVNSGSSSTDQDEKPELNDIERQHLYANIVVDVADFKVEAQSPVEALSLYVKALHIYQDILATTKKIVKTQGLSDSSRLSIVLDKLKEDFGSCLKKAEYWKRNLRPTDTAACAEKSLYDFALAMSKEGAVAEVVHKFEHARHLYRRAYLLFELLHSEAQHPTDKGVLETYMASLEKRQTTALKKQEELAQQAASAENIQMAPSSLPY